MSKPHIVIASHHKVGTVWMMTTFIRIARANGWSYIHLNEGESGWTQRGDKLGYFESRRAAHEAAHPGQPAIFHDYHGAIPDLASCKASPGVRGIHIIRDPRDMLLSAVRFHLTASEPWLDEVDQRWGCSFRDKLSGYATLEDQIALEMDTYMGWTIEQMAGFDPQGVFVNVRYEDLIVDRQMTHFHALLVHLGLNGRELINGLEAYWSSSLFGDRPEEDIRATSGHVFDAGVCQWQSMLDQSAIERIESRFGTAIEMLGYPLSSSLHGGGSDGSAASASPTINA